MNILWLDSSMRQSGSDSRSLADSLVTKLQKNWRQARLRAVILKPEWACVQRVA